jgi:hypothetical protein
MAGDMAAPQFLVGYPSPLVSSRSWTFAKTETAPGEFIAREA